MLVKCYCQRFREWLNLGVHTDVKPNDEILDILGYVAWELVERLTRTSILVKVVFSTLCIYCNFSDLHRANGSFSSPTSRRRPASQTATR